MTEAKSYKLHYELVSRVLLDKWCVLKTFFENSSEYKHLGIDFLNLLIPICKSQAPEINIWLIHYFQTENDFNNKLDVFHLIVQTTIDPVEDLRANLESMLTDFSRDVISYTPISANKELHIFHKMVTNIPIIRSTIIMKFFIEVYSALPIDIDMSPLLVRFVNNNSEVLQQTFLHSIYEYCCNDSTAFDNRYRIIKNIVPLLFKLCDLAILEKFYEGHICDMLKCKGSLNINMHIFQYVLIELLFLRISIGTPERQDCPIAIAADNPKLLHDFLKFTLDAFKNVSTESNELVRLYKCHAYNALASIIGNSLKTENVYDKLFIRHEASKDILWSGIIDTSKVYDFPITFESIPSRRKVLLSIRDEIRADQKKARERSLCR
ncbi:hypothetical protein NQ317_010039 [Molorchus minor]|uniref:DNA-dependent protein kinase catalytic subunit CC3 domain-containing protein n=1 Tax=Molorchus minor TaxID=1323400 RepID=A0ABQ9J6P3_9CUCU|nr:hypothetical protein NQ317_010039 [Molorchus minor]